jgi:hypothetical protein
MRTAIEIVKSYLLPKIEEDIYFKPKSLPESFWEKFTLILLNFERNSGSSIEGSKESNIVRHLIEKNVLELGLDSEIAERIILNSPRVLQILTRELAEEYVRGNNSEAIKIMKSKRNFFRKEVRYFYVLYSAAQISERKRIKQELPFLFEKLKTEIAKSNNDQENGD